VRILAAVPESVSTLLSDDHSIGGQLIDERLGSGRVDTIFTRLVWSATCDVAMRSRLGIVHREPTREAFVPPVRCRVPVKWDQLIAGLANDMGPP
jgi:hypothetical protein